MDTLLQLLPVTWVGIIGAAIALASAISAVTPVPKPGSVWAKVKSVIDFIALNIGSAKNAPK